MHAICTYHPDRECTEQSQSETRVGERQRHRQDSAPQAPLQKVDQRIYVPVTENSTLYSLLKKHSIVKTKQDLLREVFNGVS